MEWMGRGSRPLAIPWDENLTNGGMEGRPKIPEVKSLSAIPQCLIRNPMVSTLMLSAMPAVVKSKTNCFLKTLSAIQGCPKKQNLCISKTSEGCSFQTKRLSAIPWNFLFLIRNPNGVVICPVIPAHDYRLECQPRLSL